MSEGPESSQQPATAHRSPTAVEAARRRRALRPVMALVVVLVVGVAIAYREVPWVQRQAQGLLNPAQARAMEACEVAALKLAGTPDFARIVKPGRVHATQRGFYVERIVLGQMAQQGGEQRSYVDCYVDLDGNVVNVGLPARRGSTPPAEKR